MKKKMINITTLLLVVSFCFCSKVNAKTTYGVFSDVKYNKYSYFAGWVDKTEWSNQGVTLRQVFTTITDPCPKCRIGFKLKSSDGAYYTGMTLNMETEPYDEFRCSDGCSMPGEYTLGAARIDFTLVNTVASIAWDY